MDDFFNSREQNLPYLSEKFGVNIKLGTSFHAARVSGGTVIFFQPKKTCELRGSKHLKKCNTLQKRGSWKINTSQKNKKTTKETRHHQNEMDTKKIAMELKETSSCFVWGVHVSFVDRITCLLVLLITYHHPICSYKKTTYVNICQVESLPGSWGFLHMCLVTGTNKRQYTQENSHFETQSHEGF